MICELYLYDYLLIIYVRFSTNVSFSKNQNVHIQRTPCIIQFKKTRAWLIEMLKLANELELNPINNLCKVAAYFFFKLISGNKALPILWIRSCQRNAWKHGYGL